MSRPFFVLTPTPTKISLFHQSYNSHKLPNINSQTYLLLDYTPFSNPYRMKITFIVLFWHAGLLHLEADLA